MSPTFYKILHLAGVVLLFIGLASALMPKDTPHRKIGGIFHGIGLFLLLVAGFGLIAKLQIGFPWWIVAKLVLWLGFGAMPLIGKRGLLPVPAAWTLAAICGIAAVWLGVTHGGTMATTLPSP
ncbi:MAG: hypothetical protein O3C21_06050 [Verrucomicrobia bacterium]|nr:hypothetical protein [Verrucomicrobiota bacterium]